jgi:Methyltransferase domain
MTTGLYRLRDLVLHGTRDGVSSSPVEFPFTRDDLAALFGELGFTLGAEIGVEQGLYAETLCRANPGLHLLCVDAWQRYAGYREHVTQSKLEAFYQTTLDRLRPYAVTVTRAFSVEAARAIVDGCLDFVYIDSNHTLPQVIADLAAWAPKVRPGGIVSGHDYGRASVGHVREAILAWTQAYRIDPWMLLTDDRSPSWLWVNRG